MYYCHECGYRFDEPLIVHGGEYIDGEHWEPSCRKLCPECGSDEWETDDGDEE